MRERDPNWYETSKNFSIFRSQVYNSKYCPAHTNTWKNRYKKECSNLLLRDSNKLCGVQIGIVEVVYLNDFIIFLGVRYCTNFRYFAVHVSDLSATCSQL